jgi:hypothetical protein
MNLTRLAYTQHPRPPQRELRQRGVFDSGDRLIGHVANIYVDDDRNFRFVDVPPRYSNILVPLPNSTGTRWIEISSTSPGVLLPDISPAHHGHVLLPGGCSRLLQGPVDPVGHEGVHASLGHLFGPGVGNDE